MVETGSKVKVKKVKFGLKVMVRVGPTRLDLGQN